MSQRINVNGRRVTVVDSKIKVYDSPKNTEHFSLDVVASNADGNASVLNNSLLFDHGLQSKDLSRILYAKLLPEELDGKFSLFITHDHFDHFRPDSILRTMYYDDIISDIYGSQSVIDKLTNLINLAVNDDPRAYESLASSRVINYVKTMYDSGKFTDMLHVIEDGQPVKVDNLKITPIAVDHFKIVDGVTVPVECFAYEVENDGAYYVHATDLTNTKPLTKQYELIAIENNFSWMYIQPGKYLQNTASHLSSEDAYKFISEQLIDGGQYIELHQSKNLSVSIEDMKIITKQLKEELK